jgi:hypothetical protein
MQGNALSYLYSIEWPAFVVVAGIGWWKMVHDTPEDIVARKAHHARVRAASAEVVARTLPRSARAITVGSLDVGGRRIGTGTDKRALTEVAGASGAGSSDLVEPAAARAQAWTSDPPDAEEEYRAILQEAAEADPAPADALTEYNRYLALLAVRGRAKTWRNPKGL